MAKVTIDDLDFAAEWLDEFEDGNDPDGAAIMSKVAEWLRGQAEARRRAATVRAGMRESGAPRKQVVAALGRMAARRAAQVG